MPSPPKVAKYGNKKSRRRQRIRSYAASGFPIITSPTQVAGLTAWYDFSDISTLWQDTGRTVAVTTTGQDILGVTDKAGSGLHLSKATTGPNYTTGAINGRSVARFNGTDDYLTSPSGGFAGSAVRTMFVLAKKQTAATTTKATVWNLHRNAGLLTTDTSFGPGWVVEGTNDVGTSLGGTATNATVLVARFNSLSSLDAWAGGGAAVNVDPTDDYGTAQLMVFGALTTFFDAPGDFDIGEGCSYNAAALTASQINSVGSYLATRWGATWSVVS